MSEWFDPQPTAAEIEFWLAGGGLSPGVRKISKWPHPNTARIDAHFRLPTTIGLFPTSQKWLINNRRLGIGAPGFPPVDMWGWFDLQVVDVATLMGTIGPDPYGISFDGTVKYYELLPDEAREGVRLEAYTYLSATSWNLESGEFPIDSAARWTYRPDILGASLPFRSQTANDFPYGFDVTTDWYPFPECWTFQRLPPMGMAAFNGVDAWIDFPADMPLQTGPFQMEFDLRIYATEQVTIGGLKRFASNFWGLNNAASVSWWNQTLPLSITLPFNEWFTMRIERDWTNPGSNNYSVFVNGSEAFQGTRTVTTSPWDELGRRGSQFHGQFDLRNLTHKGGSIGSPVTLVDLPLIENACDLINPSQKGTTFNMDLASCP